MEHLPAGGERHVPGGVHRGRRRARRRHESPQRDRLAAGRSPSGGLCAEGEAGAGGLGEHRRGGGFGWDGAAQAGARDQQDTAGAGEDEPIIAVGRYERRTPGAAEFALAVEDRWQGRGIGPQLLSALADYARERGILTFIAEVLYDNGRMLSLLRHSSFPTTFQFHDGRVVGLLDISG